MNKRCDEYICFVEVKARSSKSISEPREAVTYSKQKKIIQTALQYLSVNETELQPRFDVVEIFLSQKNDSVHHIKNAFDVSETIIF